ncbi:MAG TPA: hypothetical protein VI749_08580 [Candidatus Omnitrophota bacterium]|nr:hypothetical protein [Candidatus Omnitrophota bacterium]
MVPQWLMSVYVVCFLGLSGCATVEGTAMGAKKDAEAAWAYMNDEDHWIKKTDNWMKEHLW